jgi:ABC-2 type transporter
LARLQVYWVVGLEADAGRFFTFWGILVCLQIYSASLYRFIGSCARAIVFGVSIGVVAMLVTFAGSGFVLLKPAIPDWYASARSAYHAAVGAQHCSLNLGI